MTPVRGGDPAQGEVLFRGRLRSLRRRGERLARAGRLPVREGSSPSRRHAMWTAESRAYVGDFGAGQALSDERYALLAPLIPPAKPGGRPRTTDMRRLLAGLFHLVRTGRQWRHLPPPPAFPPWRTIHGYMRAFADAGVWVEHPPPPGGDAARAGRQGAEPERRHRRHPEREDDRKDPMRVGGGSAW